MELKPASVISDLTFAHSCRFIIALTEQVSARYYSSATDEKAIDLLSNFSRC